MLYFLFQKQHPMMRSRTPSPYEFQTIGQNQHRMSPYNDTESEENDVNIRMTFFYSIILKLLLICDLFLFAEFFQSHKPKRRRSKQRILLSH